MKRLAVVDRGRPRTGLAFLRQVVAATLRFAGREEMRVSILLTDDAEIARVHGEFLGDPTPTDVISFLLDDEDGGPKGQQIGGAELIVSVETARRRAQEAGLPVRDEVALYVVHGLLHCCGYDDLRARERRRMRAAEREVLDGLGLTVRAVDD